MIALTHANLKTEIILADQLIFSFYYSQANKCTHVLATGGAIVPVLESPEEIKTKIKEIKNNGNQN